MTAGDQRGQQILKIVVVEDTRALGVAIADVLRRERFETHVVEDADAGLELARRLPADFVLLDIAVPGMDALAACRRLRLFSDAYVIMLTAQSAEADRLAGLAVADDYLTKPFFPRELVARIRAMHRRSRSTPPGAHVRRFGSLEIHLDEQRVTVDGVAIALSQTEYRLLNVLSSQPGRILSREDLLRRVWGGTWFGDEHVIDVHISNLRRRLGDDPRGPPYIATVRGVGFRMKSG